ncbi:hypothetical protein [Limimaricola soesokkakensis]|uniref:hypothetical protein n=1 Tax=Limimaricola soesokkakensis TaxID=1343159 RepID=UPI003513FE8D
MSLAPEGPTASARQVAAATCAVLVLVAGVTALSREAQRHGYTVLTRGFVPALLLRTGSGGPPMAFTLISD